jgi:hypothetical protein
MHVHVGILQLRLGVEGSWEEVERLWMCLGYSFRRFSMGNVVKSSLKSSNRSGSYNTSLLPMPQGSYNYNLVCGIRDSVRMNSRKKEEGKKRVTSIVTCTAKRYAPIYKLVHRQPA